MSKHLQLILGGARSGKSRYAERLALEQCANPVLIATATPDDDEMENRIKKHQCSRGPQWQLIEEPLALAESVDALDAEVTAVIDCLTLWLSNCLHHNDKATLWPQQRTAFIASLKQCRANVIMVSNEVGMGIIPLGALNRKFIDELGWLHQELAQVCTGVTTMTAGLPLQLK